MGEIFCYLVDMPSRIGATVVPNEDGTYTVYINSRLSAEKQRESYMHELIHINGGDIYKNMSVNEIELAARKGD